jgi:hypothetical protein
LPFISSASFIGSFFTFPTNAKFNSKKHKSFGFFNTFDFHNKFKSFLSILAFSLLLPLSLAQTQSHPLREITPIDVNLDMFKFNITNVTFVGINLTSPQYALDVAGDVRWSGTLRGGIVPWNLINGYNLNVNWTGLLGWGNLTDYNLNVPWTGLLGWRNLTGYDLNVAWSGKLGWGNLTGYNLNVPWSGSLGWGNLTGYNLSVNWVGNLGWGNLTSYPYIITQVGSGLNVSTQSLANNITLGVNFTEVQKRVTGSCSGSNAIQVINADGTVVCVDINLYGNVTGRGTPYFIPMWQTSSSITDSLINQTNGNIWITSGNLNILLGDLQIGGTNVIDSSRNILNVNWVNASYLNVSAGLVVLPSENVGIGTTNPGEKLTVVGNIRHTGSLIGGATYAQTWMRMPKEDVGGNMLVLGAAGTTILGSGESANAVAPNFGANDEVLILSSDNAMRFITNLQNGWSSRVDAMTITSSGNVGIGTTNPGSRLTISGGASYFGYLATPSGVSATVTSGGTLAAGTYYYVVTALDSSSLSSAKSTEVSCTVDGSTTNACQISWNAVSGAAKYRVWRGTSSGAENQYFETTATSYTDTGTSGTSGTPPSSPTSAYFAGNVGIGITNPSEKLEVSGNIKLSGYINIAGSYIRKAGSSIVISDV